MPDPFTLSPSELEGARLDPATVRAGGRALHYVPFDDPQFESPFDQFRLGPSAVSAAHDVGVTPEANPILSALASFYDTNLRSFNPLNISLGEAKRAGSLALMAPYNAARFVSRFLPGDLEEQLSQPGSPGAALEDLTTTGALAPTDAGQRFGGLATDIAGMVAGDKGLSKLPALSELLGVGATRAAPLVDWAATNVGGSGLYGQLLNNDAEGGAVWGGSLGLGIKGASLAAPKVAGFLTSAAEKSLGRAIAPSREGWKEFIGRNAEDIIKDVPLSAAAPWREGGGLKGIEDFAQAQVDTLGRQLDQIYASRTQADIGPQLKSFRDQVRATANGLLQQHASGALELAPASRQALEDVRAQLATGRGLLNPKDTNIEQLRRVYDQLYDVVGTLGPEMQRTALTGVDATARAAGQAIKAGVPGALRGDIRQTLSGIEDLLTTTLPGTRTETEPLIQQIEALRLKFGDLNADGEFISHSPGFTDAMANLAGQIRAYGTEINGNQLRKVARDWGKIVAGAKGTGWLASSIADESMKGALKQARGAVEGARDTLMGSAVRDKSDELSYWANLSEAAASTTQRRVGHQGGGLFGQMAAVAGLESGAGYAAHAAGHGLLGVLGAGALAAPVAMVAVRVMKSPIFNLLSAKSKLFLAEAVQKSSGPMVRQAMQRILLELALRDHGGLAALGHQDLSSVEHAHEQARIHRGEGSTPGVLSAVDPNSVYGPGGSPDPLMQTTLDRVQGYDATEGDPELHQLQMQDQIDTSIQEQEGTTDPTSPESRIQQAVPSTAGGNGFLPWLQQQLVKAPDLGVAHPHLQRLADLTAEQITPMNLGFLGSEALRPLAAGTRLAVPVELIGKGLAAAMTAAGLQTGVEGTIEGRPGKVIAGGTQALLGGLGLRGGGLATAGEEAATALTPAARRAGGFASRLGQGLARAGTQAVVGPAIGLASQGLADSDLAKALIPDDETRNAVFQAAGIGTAIGGLGMAARGGMKAAAAEAQAARETARSGATDVLENAADLPPTGLVDPQGNPISSTRKATVGNALRAREVQINEHLGALDAEPKATIVDEVANAFPVLDAFAKPTAHLSDKMLAKKAESLSPEAQQVVDILRKNLPPGERISPAEIQAIITGREYIPDRMVRKFHVSKDPNAPTLQGAPFDVTSRAHEQTRLREYMKLVKAGQDGWDWYEKGGRALMFAANDDPVFARQLAEALAATSSATDVLVNAGMGVKGVMQFRGGADVKTGRYPKAMSKKVLAAMNDEEFASGLKHTAFADALSRAGGFMSKYVRERPVNDIWQGEAWGYLNRDGTPLRRGFTESEHAWMDRMSDKALELAKRDPELAKLIPKGDGEWTLSRLQAAAWVGAKRQAAREAGLAKLRQGKSGGASANLGRVGDFGTGIENSQAQMSRESVTGATTGHLPELLAQTPEGARLRQAMHDLLRDPKFGVYDAKTRDQIIAQLGGLTGRSYETQGVFKGDIAPGVAAQVPAGYTTDPATGNRIVEPGSLALMRAADSIYALNHAQDAAAGGRVLPAGTGQPRTAADIKLAGGTPSKAVVQDIQQRIAKHGGTGDTVSTVSRPDGVALLNLGIPEESFRKLVREVNKVHGVKGGNLLGQQSGYYDTNNWRQPGQEFGQGFYPQIEPFSAQYEKFAPALARNRLALEAELNKVAGYQLTTSPVMERVHKTLANEGWAGLQKLAREFGVPVALLAAWASATGGTPPPSDDQARPGAAAGA